MNDLTLGMKNLLLLHGAIGTKNQYRQLVNALQDKYVVHTISFSGHGGSAIPAGAFSIELFAKEILDYLQENTIDCINIFGYSLGGYVGMYLAKHYPQKIETLITLATKFHWDEQVVEKEIKMLDAKIICQELPEFADQLQQRHAPQDWTVVLEKTKELMLQLGKNNPLHLSALTGIETPCLLLLGDRDKLVTWEETMAVYKHLPNAQMAMLPGTPHPMEQVDLTVLSFLINRFLQKV